MPIRRGDIVPVAVSGDHGKSRPAVVVQTDAFPGDHASLIVCQFTSRSIAAPIWRVTVQPNEDHGLRAVSQITVDKPVTIRRERAGPPFGRLRPDAPRRPNIAIALVMGLAG